MALIYQPGAFYMHGTGYVDSQDRPVFRIGDSTMAGMREAFDLQEWVEVHHEGEEVLTAFRYLHLKLDLDKIKRYVIKYVLPV